MIDGRDPSVPEFLGAQEWAAVSFPLDEMSAVEMLRGPSAALYGANAASGVLNITTKDARESRGGLVRLTGGELGTTNADVRYAAGIGGGWFFKVHGGVRNSGDFSMSRNGRKVTDSAVRPPKPILVERTAFTIDQNHPDWRPPRVSLRNTIPWSDNTGQLLPYRRFRSGLVSGLPRCTTVPEPSGVARDSLTSAPNSLVSCDESSAVARRSISG